LLTDGTHYSPQSKSGPFKYLTSRNVRFGHLDLNEFQTISEEEHDVIYAGCPVKSGDVLLTKDGANVGNVALNTLSEPFSLLSSVAVIRGSEGVLSNDYLLQFLMSPLGQSALQDEVAGQAITRVTLTTLKQLRIPLPPLPEQIEIARVLTAWDDAIARMSALIAAKTRFKTALMGELLTGERRFEEFNGQAWRTYRLGELFTERCEASRPDLPLLSITADRGLIPRGEIERKDSSNEDKKAYLRIAPRDIGYNTMRMWQGVSAVSRLEGIVSPAYTICIPGLLVNVDFAGYIFKWAPLIATFERYSQGMVADTLSLKYHNFARISVHIPAIDEQRRIVAVLQALDAEISALNRQLLAFKMQKRALMQLLLSGEKRVRVAAPGTSSDDSCSDTEGES